MQQRVLPIILPPRLQAELERRARESERDALQQARWILKQALNPSDRADRPAVEAGT